MQLIQSSGLIGERHNPQRIASDSLLLNNAQMLPEHLYGQLCLRRGEVLKVAQQGGSVPASNRRRRDLGSSGRRRMGVNALRSLPRMTLVGSNVSEAK